MTQQENPFFCPFFIEIAESFHLKAPFCPNAVSVNDEGKVVKVCPKKQEECLVLGDLKADVEASGAVLTEEELSQEKLIARWLKEKGINPSSLL